MMLKGGGCENVGAQYSLPNVALEAGRDLDGVRKVILDAVVKAQGKGSQSSRSYYWWGPRFWIYRFQRTATELLMIKMKYRH